MLKPIHSYCQFLYFVATELKNVLLEDYTYQLTHTRNMHAMWYHVISFSSPDHATHNVKQERTGFLTSSFLFYIVNWKSHQVTHLPLYPTSQWRHNERDGVSNHQLRDCLPNHLFKRRSKKTSMLHVTGLCEGNSPVIGEFPAQRANNAENVSTWWRHRATVSRTEPAPPHRQPSFSTKNRVHRAPFY